MEYLIIGLTVINLAGMVWVAWQQKQIRDAQMIMADALLDMSRDTLLKSTHTSKDE